jgi:hypothetical protein
MFEKLRDLEGFREYEAKVEAEVTANNSATARRGTRASKT